MSLFLALIVALFAGPDAGVPAAEPEAIAAPVAEGPPPDVEMECTPNPVRMGDVLVCSLTIQHREDVNVDVVTPQRFRVLDEQSVEANGPGQVQTIQEIEYRVRALKKVLVNGIQVRWTESSGAVGLVDIPMQKLTYDSLIIATLAEDRTPRTFRNSDPEERDEDDRTAARLAFLDAHGPIAYEVTNWTLFYTVGALLILALSPLVWLLIGRIREKFWPSDGGDQGPWVDPRPAHIIAYEQLQKLMEDALPEQNLHEAYYVRLSEIFRGYLKRRFQINGLEMTSEEIRRWAAPLLVSEVRDSLNEFLSETDIVKFANVVPNTEELERITRQAETFIEQTLIAEENPEGSPQSNVDMDGHSGELDEEVDRPLDDPEVRDMTEDRQSSESSSKPTGASS